MDALSFINNYWFWSEKYLQSLHYKDNTGEQVCLGNLDWLADVTPYIGEEN